MKSLWLLLFMLTIPMLAGCGDGGSHPTETSSGSAEEMTPEELEYERSLSN